MTPTEVQGALLPVDGRSVSPHCGSGKRFAMAVAKCIGAGAPVTAHLKGGIMAWKHAPYPTITLDPNTGEVGGSKIERADRQDHKQGRYHGEPGPD